MDNLSRREKALSLAGLLLGMLVAALDQTIVGTAMPKVIASLGGMHLYSWVFSAYMLSSTTMLPIFGKLSDIYGRRPFFLLGVGIFMVGSWLSGASQSMEQLIVFRGLQGLGAAAIMPIALTAIADIFPPAQRGRFQGIMASMWGMASIIGPISGGYIADHWSWRWAFYVNLPIGILAILVIYLGLKSQRDPSVKRSIDYWGVATLLAMVVPLLLGFLLGGKDYPWDSPVILGFFATSGVMLALFLYVERGAEEPLIPLALFRNSIFAVSSASVFMTGIAMFGMMAFVPLFLQGVLGVSATNSGVLLMPMMIGLVVSATAGGRLMTWVGYRIVALVAMALVVLGAYLLTTLDVSTSNQQAVLYMTVIGIGLGGTMPLFVIAVQNSVEHARMGIATSSIQFFRSMGGAMGVTLLGALLTNRLDSQISEGRLAPPGQLLRINDAQLLLEPSNLAGVPPPVLEALRAGLANSLHDIFVVALAVVLVAFIVTFFLKDLPLKKTWREPELEATPAQAGARGWADLSEP